MTETEKNNMWQIRLATLGIFVLGFVAGAFALNAYHLWFGAAKQPTKQERYQEAYNQLNLSETQQAEVQKLVSEIREKVQLVRQESEPRLQEIRSQHDENLRRVLTPEQWNEFQKLREKIRQSEGAAQVNIK